MSDTPKTEKKGMSCLAIGGIGCLVIVIALFLGGGALVAKYLPGLKDAISEYQKDATSNPDKASAKLGIKMIPNATIVREDDAAKTITFKVGDAGEEMTMHYDGLSKGEKPKMTNSKGEILDGGAAAPAAAAPAAPEASAPAPAPPAAAPAPQN
jgi:hypothetical protein